MTGRTGPSRMIADAVPGLVVAALGLVTVLGARTLPTLPGLAYGPAFFPTVIGIVLVLLGGGIATKAVRSTEAGTAIGPLPPPRRLVAAGWVVLGLLLYLPLLQPAGFVPLTTGYALVLLLLLAVRPLPALLYAALLALLVERAFVKLLLVPLPAGALGIW
ncbi:tripartite tricarboxylate transporter TctB family protein [Geminicoccaceae bacterium 1502E]|nr:tripartite tricarboxylate transporter TctB family protein [Geminicoccaceae bacterium 1502E]